MEADNNSLEAKNDDKSGLNFSRQKTEGSQPAKLLHDRSLLQDIADNHDFEADDERLKLIN